MLVSVASVLSDIVWPALRSTAYSFASVVPAFQLLRDRSSLGTLWICGLNSHFHGRGTSSLPTRPLRPTNEKKYPLNRFISGKWEMCTWVMKIKNPNFLTLQKLQFSNFQITTVISLASRAGDRNTVEMKTGIHLCLLDLAASHTGNSQ